MNFELVSSNIERRIVMLGQRPREDFCLNCTHKVNTLIDILRLKK